MRITLDTNVLISALLSARGTPALLVDLWLEEDAFQLVSSLDQLEELSRALSYERIRKRIGPYAGDILLENIRVLAQVVEPAREIEDSPDPDDNVILGTAVAGGVDLIVSGDKPGMLALGSVQGIAIVSPAEALNRLAAMS